MESEVEGGVLIDGEDDSFLFDCLKTSSFHRDHVIRRAQFAERISATWIRGDSARNVGANVGNGDFGIGDDRAAGIRDHAAELGLIAGLGGSEARCENSEQHKCEQRATVWLEHHLTFGSRQWATFVFLCFESFSCVYAGSQAKSNFAFGFTKESLPDTKESAA